MQVHIISRKCCIYTIITGVHMIVYTTVVYRNIYDIVYTTYDMYLQVPQHPMPHLRKLATAIVFIHK